MMEPFLMYIIICVASAGGCNDFAPRKPWYYRNKIDCEVMASKLYDAYIVDMEKRRVIIIDGKSFCLRFKESKDT